MPFQHRKQLTPRQERLVDRLIEKRIYNDQRIARHFGVTKDIIFRRRQKKGVEAVRKHSRRRISRQKLRQATEMYQNGQSIVKISAVLNVPYGAARTELRLAGVKRRTQVKEHEVIVKKNIDQVKMFDFEAAVNAEKQRIGKIAPQKLAKFYGNLNREIQRVNGLIVDARKKTRRGPGSKIVGKGYIDLLEKLRGLRVKRDAVFQLLPPNLQLLMQDLHGSQNEDANARLTTRIKKSKN